MLNSFPLSSAERFSGNLKVMVPRIRHLQMRLEVIRRFQSRIQQRASLISGGGTLAGNIVEPCFTRCSIAMPHDNM